MANSYVYAIGDRIQVKTIWGSGPTVSGTVTSLGFKNDRPVISYRQDGHIDCNWAYADHVLPPAEFKEATHLNYIAIQDEAKRIALWLDALDQTDAKARYAAEFQTELSGWLDAFETRPTLASYMRQQKQANGGART